MNKAIQSILLVDDDYATNRYNKIIIEEAGLTSQVWEANDGTEALSLLKDTLQVMPDVILLDLNMPKMNGWEFLDELPKLRDQALTQVKIYILSASRNPDDMEKSRQYNQVQGFISKPLEVDEVKSLIVNVAPSVT